MSKFLALGMEWNDIVDCVTEAPAKQWRDENNMGCLLPNTVADLTVIKREERPMKFEDKYGNVVFGDTMVIPEMTVIGGKVKYQSMRLHP